MLININRRFKLISIIIYISIAVLCVNLFKMQIIDGEKYSKVTSTRGSAVLTETAPRGEIFDRYGTPIVTNKECYSVSIFKLGYNNYDLNQTLIKVLNILDESEDLINDKFPMTYTKPFKYTFDNSEEKKEWFYNNKYSSLLDESMSANDVFNILASNIYDIDNSYSDNIRRRILGIRYEADIQGFSNIKPYTISDNVNAKTVSVIRESIPSESGVCITNNYVREFCDGSIASHLIGRIGKLNEDEYRENKSKGYGYNDVIGKQGIEKYCENYLRGENGYKGTEYEVDGNSVSIISKKNVISGNNVVLTLDLDLQKVVEESLERNINTIQKSGSKGKGQDCTSGAAVVLDVRNGDVLACASYPTYDISKFNEDYKDLADDDTKPLWNRALSGTYTPGSTFKPLIAIAALETSKISPTEKIIDEGVYKYYDDYQPSCWIWNEHKTTHGPLTVSQAIEHSCNYFFYETGRRLGINTIQEYAKKFGLGTLTGIGLSDEAKGSIASSESKKRAVKNVIDQSWFGGDTLQAAIGQSYNLFTPLQLANYVATIANGGKRYKVNLVKGVYSPSNGNEILTNKPVVEQDLQLKPETLKVVKNGMRNVIDEGSASAIFKDYKISLGGKTGTAQLGNGQSNNALFIAFAPFDEPQIAVCVVLEHGVVGANSAYVAKDIFDYYFKLNEQSIEN